MRLQSLLRTKRVYSIAELVRLYKCHVLSYIEGATPAIYHAAEATLRHLDGLQDTFLEGVGLTPKEALLEHNLGPLGTRRDIAMLGLLYKVAHGRAPPSLASLFEPFRGQLARYGFSSDPRLHSKALHEPLQPGHPRMLHRSIYGLIPIFNRLPGIVVRARSVKGFQRSLQRLAKDAAATGSHEWSRIFRPG